MNKNIDHQLKQYSKITFAADLDHVENDVKRRMFSKKNDRIKLRYLIEEWLGMPPSMGIGAVASTLIVSVFLGLQMAPVDRLDGASRADELGLDVFSAQHAQLPSTLLVPRK